MKVVAINGDRAVVDLSGVRREVSMQLIDGGAVGDYVIVHAGFAIEKLDEAEALETLSLIEAMVRSMDEGTPDAGA
jgi:hydrogenase expression/formation protein HypC